MLKLHFAPGTIAAAVAKGFVNDAKSKMEFFFKPGLSSFLSAFPNDL